MNKRSIQFIALAIVLVLLQAVVLNNVCLWGVAMVFAYIYVIARLPMDMSQCWALTIAFVMGLTVDVFANTPGLNSLACVTTAGLRRPILRLYFQRDDTLADTSPQSATLGFAVFAKFALTISFVYCLLLFVIEAFSLLQPLRLVLRIAASTVLTALSLIALDALTSSAHEKRL